MRIVTRAEWSARPPKAAPAKVSLSARTASCTHHDGATPVIISSFEAACWRVRADQAYHMDHNGWNDIGYNFLVISAPGVAGVDGLIFEGRGRDVIGAHCLNHNTEWIGIQVAIGGDQVPSPAALASVRWLHDTFEVAAGRQLGRKVHSDGFNTACPGPFLKTWVHAGMQVRATQPASPLPPALVVKPPAPKSTRNIPMTKAIQNAVHVTADGYWGDATSKAATVVIKRVLTDVKYAQLRVGAYPDGRWGPLSEAARTSTIRKIQSAIGVTSDGAWGPISQARWVIAYANNFKRY